MQQFLILVERQHDGFPLAVPGDDRRVAANRLIDNGRERGFRVLELNLFHPDLQIMTTVVI